MDQLGKVTLYTLSIAGHDITFNPTTFIMTWLVMIILVYLGYLGAKNLTLIPGKLQSIFEVIIEFLKEIVYGTLGDKDGKRYLPFIVTIFLFTLLSNWIGIIPNISKFIGTMVALLHTSFGGDSFKLVVDGFFDIKLVSLAPTWYSFLLKVPALEEPTKFVNTDLALGLLVFFAVQGFGIKNKGFWGYIANYVDDPFPMKGWLKLFFFLNPFFYLNIIGAVANVVSHSFRIFGNIFGGGMIIVIVSTLLKYLIAPVGLFAFFGLFAGLVQAFVFTMLTVTYIQQQQ